MKSYLKNNNKLLLGLNEDLQIGKRSGMSGLFLDDCNFHECVNL